MEINSGGASRAHGDFSSSSSPSGLKTCLQDFISKSKGFSDNPDDQAKELSQAFLNLTQGVSSLDDPKLLKLESTLDSLSLPLSRVCSSSPVQVELLSTVRMAALSFVTSLNSLMTSSGLPTFSDSQVTNVKENFSDSAVNNIFNLVDLNSDNYNQNEFAGQAITYVNQTQQVFNQEFYQDNNPLTTQLMSLSQEANNLYDNQGDAGAGLGVDLAAHLLIQFFG